MIHNDGTQCMTGAQFANDNNDMNTAKVKNTSTRSDLRGTHTLEARKPLPTDSEITIHYGPLYWSKKFDTDTQDTPPHIIFPNLTEPFHPPPTLKRDTPTACLAYSISNTMACIDEIYTDDNYRNQGLARSLIKLMIQKHPQVTQVTPHGTREC